MRFPLTTPLIEHQRYVEDANRLEAYRRALEKRLKPGMVVLDLGAGTGVLGLLACQAGAARVYAVDDGPVLRVAEQLAKANGLADRIVAVEGHSSWVQLPEQVDLVVADQMSSFGVGAGLLPCFADARRRLLKPTGGCLPERLEMWVAPVACPAMRQRLAFWSTQPQGLDLTPVQPLMANMGHVLPNPARALLAERQPLGRYQTGVDPGVLDATLRFECVRAGRVDGLLGCFRAILAEGIAISNAPDVADRIDREPLVLPSEPLEVTAGEVLEARVKVDHENLILSWSLGRAGTRTPLHSTFLGLPFHPRHAQGFGEANVPRLSPLAEARRTVLTGCDGQTSIAALAEQLMQQHADFFEEPRQAEAFVLKTLR